MKIVFVWDNIPLSVWILSFKRKPPTWWSNLIVSFIGEGDVFWCFELECNAFSYRYIFYLEVGSKCNIGAKISHFQELYNFKYFVPLSLKISIFWISKIILNPEEVQNSFQRPHALGNIVTYNYSLKGSWMLIWQTNHYVILFLWNNAHEVISNWLSEKHCKDNMFIWRWTVYKGPIIGYITPPEASLLQMQLYNMRKKLPTCLSLSVYTTLSLQARWLLGVARTHGLSVS